MFGTVQDITDRKWAEEALQRTQFYLSEAQRLARYSSFFEVGDEFPATLNASKPRQNCEAPKPEKHRMPYRGFELYSALRCRRVPRQLTSQILAGESWLHL
jgi:hypothetical protein